MSPAPASTLEIACAKPECHWKGPPGEAPGHPCPTPEEAAGDPFDGLETIATSPPPEPDDEPIDEDAAAKFVAYEADPSERDAIELWLAEYGNYDTDGIPQDEKTATLDARLSVLQDADPEPPLEEPTTVEADGIAKTGIEAVFVEDVELAGDDPRPMEVAIAEQVGEQTAVADYRWLVVYQDGTDGTAEAVLVGRGKTKAEANEVADKIVEQGPATRAELQVVKTQAIIEAADEIKRKLIEGDPDATSTEPGPEADDNPEPEPEPTAAPKPPEKPGDQGKLLDPSAYDREDLAIPKVDGQGIDRIRVGFSGGVMLDRSEPADVALYNRLKLGDEVELRVSARVSGTGAKGATNREGDLDVVVGEKTLHVTTVYVLTPEQLGAE